jgi:hypothetical protein
MKTPTPVWPLDQVEHLAEALREQGASEEQILDLSKSLMRLNEWQAPSPTHADEQQLIEGLLPYLPGVTPTRRVLRARPNGLISEFFTLLRLVKTQVSLFQPSFWLVSCGVVFFGGLLILGGPLLNPIFLLQVTGPLLSYLGTTVAFRGNGLHMLEFELACPPSPRQLTLSRLVIVLSYDILLGLLLSTFLWSFSASSFWLLTLHWLAPLLLETGLTLLLSLRVPIHQAAGISYVGWLALLVVGMISQNGVGRLAATFSYGAELGFALAGLVMVGLLLIFLPKAITGLLPRQ